MSDVNREHKSSLFTKLFEDPEKLIPLYNAISGSNYSLDTPVEITTLSNVLYLNQLNDLSFTIDNKIVVIIEHQSTINENMPIRMLIYLARVYEAILNDTKKIYAKKLVKIPRPEFIVMYNGTDDFPAEMTLKLSDAYHKVDMPSAGGDLELEVKVVNINKEFNNPILQNNTDLDGYATFIAEIRKNQESKMLPKEAMDRAIRDCINRDILAEFLKRNGSEVFNMLFNEFNMDDCLKVRHEEGVEEGLQKGLQVGLQKGALTKAFDIARNLLTKNIPLDIIKDATGLSLKEIECLQ